MAGAAECFWGGGGGWLPVVNLVGKKQEKHVVFTLSKHPERRFVSFLDMSQLSRA